MRQYEHLTPYYNLETCKRRANKLRIKRKALKNKQGGKWLKEE